MKITMLGWELPPHNSGGLGVACYNLAKQLAQDGFEINFVVPYRARHRIKEFKVIGATDITPAELYRSANAYHSSGTIPPPNEESVRGGLDGLRTRYARFVQKLVADDPPDVIHAHDWLTFDAAVAAKRLCGSPFIAHVHATEYDRSGNAEGNLIVHDIEYQSLLLADKIIAVSRLTKRTIVEKYHIPADKIEVLHNAPAEVPPPETVADSPSYPYLEEMRRSGWTVVASLGRLTVQKGLNYLLEAAKLAVEKNPRLIFLLAGDGEQRDQLLLRCAQLGLGGNVAFSGFVRGQRWRDSYGSADLFVMSSVSEPFGLTALEAAACRLPLIITRQSGVGETISHALKYDYWDTHRLASLILAAAEQTVLRHELADNAASEINRLSWREVARGCSRIYRQHSLVEASP
ncbi:MAG: glycosyltransferase family 1 protein [Candidatus Chaera renei]|uniref:Glycosyltransferase family 1 protein n=1 Tax=Candidatus Chaera renei TaxID=2506947 RepID=A0A4Q0AGN5_9BACT|nr:MAG: glycosyltransferase family 1 protein [Candidatus Chaera renei]